jgi:hypothetical protein
MKNNRIIILGIGLIIIVLPTLIIGYQIYLFDGPKNEIKKTINELPDDYKKMDRALKDLIVYIEGIPSIRNFLSKQLIHNYCSNSSNRRLFYQIRLAIWQKLLKMNFSNDEIISLWCFYAPYANGQGLNEASNYEFGKELTHLNLKEIITLIANTRAPLYYKQNPSRLKLRVNNIFADWKKNRSKNNDQ